MVLQMADHLLFLKTILFIISKQEMSEGQWAQVKNDQFINGLVNASSILDSKISESNGLRT